MVDKSIVALVQNETIPDQTKVIEMVHEAINLLGGIQKFVKEGDTVVIKGNFFAPAPPPVTVDRRVVRGLIREIKTANPSKIIVAEAVSVGTKMGRKRNTMWIVEEMGILDVVKEEGAEFLCIEDDQRVKVPAKGGRCLQEIYYPKTLLECDVLIDLPCMKTHAQTLVTLGIKNFQGILTDEQKYHSHRDDLSQKLVDIFRVRIPDLTFIDGLLAMEGDGAGEEGIPKPMNMLVASGDLVSADAVAAACMGIEDVLDVTTIRLAQFYKMGNGDLDKIEVRGKTIDEVKQKFVLPFSYAKPYDRYGVGCYDNLDIYIGGACRECWHRVANIGLNKYKDTKFTIICGCDPKVPTINEIDNDIDNIIFFGDCACGASGNAREIRNAMLLKGKGLFAPGCPPFRPAAQIIDAYLVKKGLKEPPKEGPVTINESARKCYEYYKKIDPTWVPKSEQKK